MEEKLEVTKVEETPLSNGKTLKELASELNRTQNLYCQDKACTELGKAFMCAGVGIAIVFGTIMGLTKGANSACIAALSGFMVSCFGFVLYAQFGKWIGLDKACLEGAEERYKKALDEAKTEGIVAEEVVEEAETKCK